MSKELSYIMSQDMRPSNSIVTRTYAGVMTHWIENEMKWQTKRVQSILTRFFFNFEKKNVFYFVFLFFLIDFFARLMRTIFAK